MVRLRNFFVLLLFFTANAKQARKAVPDAFINPMQHSFTEITPKSFDRSIVEYSNHDGVSVLLHFDSSKEKQRAFIEDPFNKAAKQASGLARFFAVDCASHRKFCEGHMNPELVTPSVVVYPPSPLPPLVIKDLQTKDIVNTAMRFVPDKNVKKLTAQTIDGFLGSHVAVPKVLLFTDKEKSPVLFNALANSFKDRVSFGLVPSNESVLTKKYKIEKVPTVILLKSAPKGSGLAAPLVYKGEAFAFHDLHAWINVHAETFVKGGGFVETIAAEEIPRPWLVQKVPEVTGQSHQDICFKGTSLCVILLTRSNITPEEMALMEDVSSKYSGDVQRGAKFKFMWLNLDIETNFEKILSPEHKGARFVVVNPHKRLRYLALHDKTGTPTITAITTLLEHIQSGDTKFTIVAGGKLLPFAARQPAEAQKDAKEEL